MEDCSAVFFFYKSKSRNLSITALRYSIKNEPKDKQELVSSCYLVGTKAARTYVNSLVCTVFNNLYLADVCLECSVCLSVRVRYVATECNALTTYCTLCHLKHLHHDYILLFNNNFIADRHTEKNAHSEHNGDIITHTFPKINSFFDFFCIFLKFLIFAQKSLVFGYITWFSGYDFFQKKGVF